ncbi:hypothetical protein L9F63_009855, partial [Diploptera punctata]
GRQYTVRLGDVDLERDDEPSSPETFRVVEIREHPWFNKPFGYNDLAIMLLDRTPTRSRYVMPLCLPPPSAHSDTFVDQTATVVGWGNAYEGGDHSTVQRQVELPVWQNDICYQHYIFFRSMNSSFICAGDRTGRKHICQ